MKTGKIFVLLLAILMITTTGAAAETGTEAINEGQSGVNMKDQKNTNGGINEIKPSYPQPAGEGMDAETFLMGDAHWEWWQGVRDRMDKSAAQQKGMEDYYAAILKEIVAADADENTVCSPLNIYIALSMLAEVTDGTSRAQILDVLQVNDIDTLRSRTKALWDANYMDTPVVKSLLANSLWLRDDIGYHEDTLQRLAADYFASSISGEMGSGEMDQALRTWTDENTGGLLSDYTKDMHLQPETVLALVSTIYYKAAWIDKFPAESTDEAVFHGASGDTQVSMMHRDDMMSLYKGKNFTAVSLGLNDAGLMYFFLPNEGTDVKDIACDSSVLRICRGDLAEESSYPIVHLSVPKFEVSKKTDLISTLEKLGITDALNRETADFSPLTDEVSQMWIDSAEHAALVKIDEEGVTGAAFTDLAVCGAGLPQEEADFTLDRPFYFAVTSDDGSILFSGIVQTIE